MVVDMVPRWEIQTCWVGALIANVDRGPIYVAIFSAV